jgi:Domain of unknown function (DUF4381)
MNEPAIQNLAPQNLDPQSLNPQNLDLRDIHLPDPVSWWPIAPGWWIVLASLILFITIIFVARKFYISRQLRRDIKAELERIKKQYQQTQNKTQLAKALSILLRRASISYYPKADIAGLIGKDWLAYLDSTHTCSSANKNFQSDIGQVLLTAPYIPEENNIDFDAQALIQLSESWLRSSHKSPHKKASPAVLSRATPS